jgi:hypothetical protein
MKELKEKYDSQNNEINKQKNEINNLKNYIDQINNDKDISKYDMSKYYLTFISNPMKVLNLIKTKSIYREETIERYEQLYKCFENVSKYFKTIKERENDLCIKIIKYIGKDIKEDKEKEEWRAIKKEILNKYGSSVYYKGLVLFLFGEDHEIKEDFSILSGNDSETRNYVKNFVVFLSLFMDNSPNEDIEEKFQSVIVYIAVKIIGIKTVSELFDKAGKIMGQKNDAKVIKKIIKSLMQDIITSFNSQNKKRLLDSYPVQK